MVKIKSFFVSPFWGRLFNKYNLTKIVSIFIVGFLFRVIMGIILDLSVFSEFTHYIFIICSLIGGFTFLDNEMFLYFNFEALKLSSIKKVVSYYLNFNKVNITNNSSSSGVDNIFLDSKINNFNSYGDFSKFDKFKNKGKRDIFWICWEKYTSNFDSYKTFKESWDPNIKVRTVIRNDIKNGVWKVKVFKNTAKRIWDSVFS